MYDMVAMLEIDMISEIDMYHHQCHTSLGRMALVVTYLGDVLG